MVMEGRALSRPWQIMGRHRGRPSRFLIPILPNSRLALRMLPKFSLYYLFAIATAVAASSVFAEKRNITEKDLFDFFWIGDPQISPDGARVAFVRVTVN